MGGASSRVAQMKSAYDDVVGDINTINTAINKLLSGEMKDSDVLELIQEFPKLLSLGEIDLNDGRWFGDLYSALMQIRGAFPDDLLAKLKEFRKTLSDPADINLIDSYIEGLERLTSYDNIGGDAITHALEDAFGRTDAVVQSTLTTFENLGKLQEAIADGFVIDAEKAWELAKMFPELTGAIKEYGTVGDGLVELNEEIVRGLLEGGDTAVDMAVEQLEAEKATLIAKRDATQEKLDIAQKALETEGSLQKISTIYEVELFTEGVKEKVQAEQFIVNAVAKSSQNQAENMAAVGKKSAEVAEVVATNMGGAAQDASASVADSSNSMQVSLSNIVDAARGAWQALQTINSERFEGYESNKGGGWISNIVNRAKTWASDTFNAAKTRLTDFTSNIGGLIKNTFGTLTSDVRKFASGVAEGFNEALAITLDEPTLNNRLEELILDLNTQLGDYNSAIEKIDGQITTLKNLQGNAAERIAKSGKDNTGSDSGSDRADEAQEEFSETIDWIERAIAAIEKGIERLSTAAGNVYMVFSKRNSALVREMGKVREEIVLQEEAYETYLAIAESVDLNEEYKSKVRQGLLQIEEIENEELANKIKIYQEWYDKSEQCIDAIQRLEIELGNLSKQKFDDLASNFDRAISTIEHRANMINGALDKSTEDGYIAAASYYEELTRVENENLVELQEKREALIGALADAVKSGAVEEGSEAWHEMQQGIDGVTEAIQDAEKALISYGNSIRQVNWDIFDRIRDSIGELTEETDFLMNLLGDEENFTDGDITNRGQAAYGLHAVNYQVYMSEAAAYADEIRSINKSLATDPYDTALIDRRKELIGLQREMIQNAEDEKEAMKSLTSEGIESYLSAMQKSIDAYKEMMSEWQDNYTFEKTVKEQTEAIATLQKQLSAYSGDTSESGRLNTQKTLNSLRDAQEKLSETQRDHYISETEKILDNLYSEAETALNGRLDHFEELLVSIFDSINMNAAMIGQTLRETTGAVDTQLSEAMDGIWPKIETQNQALNGQIQTSASGVETAVDGVTSSVDNGVLNLMDGVSSAGGNIKDSVTGMTASLTTTIAQYGEKVGTVPDKLTSCIEAIRDHVGAMAKDAEDRAAAEIKKQQELEAQTKVTQEVANKVSQVASNTSAQVVNTNVATTGQATATPTPKASSGSSSASASSGSSSASKPSSSTTSTGSAKKQAGDFFVYAKSYYPKDKLNVDKHLSTINALKCGEALRAS